MRRSSRPRRSKVGAEFNRLADADAPLPPEVLDRLRPAFEALRGLKLEMVGPCGLEVLRRVEKRQGRQDWESLRRVGAILGKAPGELGRLTLGEVEGLADAWLAAANYLRGGRPARRRRGKAKRGGPRALEAAIFLELAEGPACSTTALARRLGVSRRLLYLSPYREALAAGRRLAAEDRAKRGRELLARARRV